MKEVHKLKLMTRAEARAGIYDALKAHFKLPPELQILNSKQLKDLTKETYSKLSNRV